MTSATLTLDEGNFEAQVLRGDGVKLVDFWAEWCGPCLALAPTLETLAREHSEATIGKVDVDANPQLAASYGVQSIPTLLFFRGGELRDRIVGVASRSVIERRLEELSGPLEAE